MLFQVVNLSFSPSIRKNKLVKITQEGWWAKKRGEKERIKEDEATKRKESRVSGLNRGRLKINASVSAFSK